VSVWNFSAGPAVFPKPVLERIAFELPDWHGTGQSVLELSHRSPAFEAIIADAEAALRRLLGVSDDYAVLFLQGGATLQFAAVPLNLAATKAAYVDSGAWAQKAIKEAQRYLDVDVVWSGRNDDYRRLPRPEEIEVLAGRGYLHLTSNETIGGVQLRDFPKHDLLVADMSSDILSRPLDVGSFGVIYAGAQKNLGPAGLTVVIVRKDLLRHAAVTTPSAIDYTQQAANGSLLNTPPTFAIYAAGLVFAWLEELGGLEEIALRNEEKAAFLYTAIDASDFYHSPIAPADRSLMNAPFRAPEALEPLFLQEASQAGLLELKGHRSVGGMRASLYNAMPLAGVQALVAFMGDFEGRNG
jgi:phosphoserine aminotransferase